MASFAADVLAETTSTLSGAADDAAPIILVGVGVSLLISVAFGFWRLSKRSTNKAL